MRSTAPRPARSPAPADYQAQSTDQPAVFSIRPAAGSPEVSRLATDGQLLRAAFEEGRAAARAVFKG